MTPAALLHSCWTQSQIRNAYLAHHSLGNLAGVETVVQTQPTDVRVRADTLNASEVFDFLDFAVDA